MKILIVEDEPKTGDYLRQGLAEAGFTVDLVRDGWTACTSGPGRGHDLVVLDVNLPGLDGWQVLQALRAAGRDLPVLFLTARDRVEDRVRGLELGLTIIWSSLLPFRTARPGAPLLRRGRAKAAALALADLELDVLKRRVAAAASASI